MDSLAVAASAPSRTPTMFSLSSLSVMPLPLSGRRLNFASFAEVKGLRIQTPSKLSSLVSGNTRNPLVRRECAGSDSVVSEAQENAIDIPIVTDATWESLVLKAEGPVLVEFWAPWCGPCRLIHPEVAELSAQYAGKLKSFKMNTDESPSTANKYGIRSIPTIMIFVNGEKKDAVIGSVPRTTLISAIGKFI